MDQMIMFGIKIIISNNVHQRHHVLTYLMESNLNYLMIMNVKKILVSIQIIFMMLNMMKIL